MRVHSGFGLVVFGRPESGPRLDPVVSKHFVYGHGSLRRGLQMGLHMLVECRIQCSIQCSIQFSISNYMYHTKYLCSPQSSIEKVYVVWIIDYSTMVVHPEYTTVRSV
jgi:hypothetical protein